MEAKPSGVIDLTLDTAIRNHVAMVLDYCDGSQKWACEELGIDPSTLWRWIKKWRMDVRKEPVDEE